MATTITLASLALLGGIGLAGLIVLTEGAVVDALFAAAPRTLAEANPMTMHERFLPRQSSLNPRHSRRCCWPSSSVFSVPDW